MQRKTAAGDNVRQGAVLIHKFVKVKIVVAYHKLDIDIWKLGLDIGSVFFIHCRAPHIYRNGVGILFRGILCAAACQKACCNRKGKKQANQSSFLHLFSPLRYFFLT